LALLIPPGRDKQTEIPTRFTGRGAFSNPPQRV
jgi:hypothetical protein